MKDYYIVYTREGCPYCDKAIGTLREQNEPFMVGDLTHNPDLLAEVMQQNEMKTIPIVQYIVHKEVPWQDRPIPHPMLVGGSSDLIKHFEESEEEQQEEEQEE